MKIVSMEDPSFTVPAESPGIVLSKRRLLPIEMPWNWWLVIQRWGSCRCLGSMECPYQCKNRIIYTRCIVYMYCDIFRKSFKMVSKESKKTFLG